MMSINNSINRAELLRIAGLVRPALATQDYIPALTHIKFDKGYATAYNDISSIAIRAELNLNRCVPGDLLIRALGSFGGENVAIAFDDKTSALLLSSGRSKLKLPTMNIKDYPFDIPPEEAPSIVLTPEIIKGVERCLISVGNDPTHPAQMGVTLEVDALGKAILYSTDNFTISSFRTSTAISLPGDSPIILPTFFCEQLVSLSKAFPKEITTLYLFPGAICVDFGTEAILFNKTVLDLEPMDFQNILKKHCNPAKVANDLQTIPDAFDAAFNRALLVLSNELDKSTQVKINSNGITLSSSSNLGDSFDEIEFKANGADKEFLIDPSLVIRASKCCSKLSFYPKVMLLSDDSGSFLHLIAHCSS